MCFLSFHCRRNMTELQTNICFGGACNWFICYGERAGWPLFGLLSQCPVTWSSICGWNRGSGWCDQRVPGLRLGYRHGTLKSPATICWVSSKITIVGIFTILRDTGFRNCRFNFLLYWNALWVFYWVMNVLLCFPFLFENTENVPLIEEDCCTQCALPLWFHH